MQGSTYSELVTCTLRTTLSVGPKVKERDFNKLHDGVQVELNLGLVSGVNELTDFETLPTGTSIITISRTYPYLGTTAVVKLRLKVFKPGLKGQLCTLAVKALDELTSTINRHLASIEAIRRLAMTTEEIYAEMAQQLSEMRLHQLTSWPVPILTHFLNDFRSRQHNGRSVVHISDHGLRIRVPMMGFCFELPRSDSSPQSDPTQG